MCDCGCGRRAAVYWAGLAWTPECYSERFTCPVTTEIPRRPVSDGTGRGQVERMDLPSLLSRRVETLMASFVDA